MDTEHILWILRNATLKAVSECREIAKYVLRDDLVGRSEMGPYKSEDEIVFKAILFNELREELRKMFDGAPKGRTNSITLELAISKTSIPILRKNPNVIKFPPGKIDIAISEDSPWRDLENENELILIEVKNPLGMKNGVLTRKNEIYDEEKGSGIKPDMCKLNGIKSVLRDKVTTVMIVAYIGNKGCLDEVKVRDINLKDAAEVDHLWIY